MSQRAPGSILHDAPLVVCAAGVPLDRLLFAIAAVPEPGFQPLPHRPYGRLRSRHGVAGMRTAATSIRRWVAGRLDDRQVWVGVGVLRPSDEETGLDLGEADEAVLLGRALDPTPRAVVLHDALVGAALSGSRAMRDRLASLLDVVRPLEGGRTELLLETLEAFYGADLSIRNAAKNLGIHRHTLENRIKRVERATGLSVRRWPDRIVAEMALMATRLRERSEDDPLGMRNHDPSGT